MCLLESNIDAGRRMAVDGRLLNINVTLLLVTVAPIAY